MGDVRGGGTDLELLKLRLLGVLVGPRRALRMQVLVLPEWLLSEVVSSTGSAGAASPMR